MVSLVAGQHGERGGHIAFSCVTIGGVVGNWFHLGPVSVRPDVQSQDIGSALIREGLVRITALDAEGCVLRDFPAYFSRSGFQHAPGLIYAGVAHSNFQQLTFKGETPKGDVLLHSAVTGAG